LEIYEIEHTAVSANAHCRAGGCVQDRQAVDFGPKSCRQTVARPDKDEPLYLWTSDFERPAADRARLYKERWDTELLFKWLKQNLKIRRCLGRGETAVRTQIDVARIALMLPRIRHHTAARVSRTAPCCSSPTSSSACLAPSASAKPQHPRPYRRRCGRHPHSHALSPVNPHRPQNPAQQCAQAATHPAPGSQAARWTPPRA
jgi:hypothetical protein